MLYQNKLIEEPFGKFQLMSYLERELDRAGLVSVDVQRTPLVTRITLEVTNPARIIGRRGRLINDLTEVIKKEFGIENPQISVVEVRDPYLEPRMVAKKAAKYIEMGKKLRSVLHFLLREIIKSGALGAEIVASGKIGQKGAKAKKLRVAAGYIPKSGEPARSIKVAHLHANTKSGIIGVFVRIVPPGTVFPDKKVTNVVLPKVIEHATEVANRAPASEAESESAQGGSPPRGAPGRGGPFRGGPNRGGFNRDGQGSRRPQRRRE